MQQKFFSFGYQKLGGRFLISLRWGRGNVQQQPELMIKKSTSNSPKNFSSLTLYSWWIGSIKTQFPADSSNINNRWRAVIYPLLPLQYAGNTVKSQTRHAILWNALCALSWKKISFQFWLLAFQSRETFSLQYTVDAFVKLQTHKWLLCIFFQIKHDY